MCRHKSSDTREKKETTVTRGSRTRHATVPSSSLSFLPFPREFHGVGTLDLLKNTRTSRKGSKSMRVIAIFPFDLSPARVLVQSLFDRSSLIVGTPVFAGWPASAVEVEDREERRDDTGHRRRCSGSTRLLDPRPERSGAERRRSDHVLVNEWLEPSDDRRSKLIPFAGGAMAPGNR